MGIRENGNSANGKSGKWEFGPKIRVNGNSGKWDLSNKIDDFWAWQLWMGMTIGHCIIICRTFLKEKLLNSKKSAVTEMVEKANCCVPNVKCYIVFPIFFQSASTKNNTFFLHSALLKVTDDISDVDVDTLFL